MGAEGAAVTVGEGNADRAGEGGAVAFLGAGQAARAQRGVGAAVESAVEADDLETAAVALHDADGALDGLAAGREEEAFVEMRRQDGDELFGGLDARLVQAFVVVEELGGGGLDGFDQIGVAMADVGDEHAGGPVDEGVAVHVGDQDARGAVPDDGGLIAGALGLDAGPAGEQGLGARAGQGSLDGGDLGHG